ncbi:immunoglobulin gamma-1 heavy chain-like [Amblyraja radiata]|uniref:immunoglobulin gamma-1 heavy chain-like n=1 Tax=Amblyraja radiata TaxID=386614 RepID=UPI00140288CC|nr:immunoglobulin gamma-1 heavy chain-like [Amblyraja radiata]
MGVAAYLCLLLSCLPGVRSAIVLNQTPTVVAKPGESLKLTCETSGFSLSSYAVSWVKQVPGKGLEWVGAIDYDDDEYYATAFRGRFEVSKDSSNVYLQMTSLSLADTAIYYCARDTCDYLEYWGAGTSLTVTSEDVVLPSVHITSSCNTESGQEISILCLVKDYQPAIISQTWSTSSGVIATGITKYPPVLGQNNKYTMSSLLRVPVADWNRKTVYYCKAGSKPDNMVITAFPKLQAPQLIPLVPSPEVLHNQTTAILGCMISGFSPDNIKVSWKKAGLNQAGVVLPSTPRTNGGFETVAYLPLSVEEWTNKQEYTCEVTHAPSGFSDRINMRYQDGGECPGCSKCLPKFIYQSNLDVTFSDGSTRQYNCWEGKCEIK